jgi:hypothetical protein
MQVGFITVDGMKVGNVTLTESGVKDHFTSDIDDVPEGRAGDPQHSPHPGGRHHAPEHAAHPGAHMRDRVHNAVTHGTAAHLSDRAHHHTGHAAPPVNIAPGDRVHGQFAAARDRAREELASKPWLREKVLRIAANEQGSHPLGTQGVLETMVNRAAVRGTSLEAQAKWHRSEHGYYQEGSLGRGALENPHSRAILNESLERVLQGSNATAGATDNSSSSLAAREKASGSFRHHRDINGESFFSPGSAEPALRDRWQRLNYESNAMQAAEEHAAKKEADRLAAGEAAP